MLKFKCMQMIQPELKTVQVNIISRQARFKWIHFNLFKQKEIKADCKILRRALQLAIFVNFRRFCEYAA